MKTKKLIATIIALAVPIILIAGERHLIEKTVDLKPGGMLSVKSDDGNIKIKGWNRDQVLVRATIVVSGFWGGNVERKFDRTKVYAEKSGDEVRVWANKPNNCEVHFDINMPVETSLDIRTDDGEITIEKVKGNIQLDTEDGDIFFYDVAGNAEVHSDDGEIRFEAVKGDVDIRTNDGDIRGEFEPRKNVRVKTDDGDINLRVKIAGEERPDVYIRTDDGSVNSDFPVYTSRPNYHDENLFFDLHTNDGDIRLVRVD